PMRTTTTAMTTRTSTSENARSDRGLATVASVPFFGPVDPANAPGDVGNGISLQLFDRLPHLGVSQEPGFFDRGNRTDTHTGVFVIKSLYKLVFEELQLVGVDSDATLHRAREGALGPLANVRIRVSIHVVEQVLRLLIAHPVGALAVS